MQQGPSFEEIYAQHRVRIFRFCFRLCGNAADAEDLAQDAFLRAYQAFSSFEGRSSVATWLCRIALRRWQDLRDSRRLEMVPLDESQEAAAEDDMAQRVVDRIEFQRALNALPEPLRVSFLLVKVGGLKYREAAEVLGIPQGTVQSRVHDAALQLRALLAPGCDEPCRAGDRGGHPS